MSYFTRATLRFLTELEEHNERPWFEANKARYQADVKEPADHLLRDAGAALGMAGRVMRIHRDVRFSKDKSPYKTNLGIVLQPSGAPKGTLVGGVYLHVTPRENFIACGLWHPSAPQLAAVRDAIVADPTAWKRARKVGLDEDDEALQRAPRGFDPDHPLIDDLRRKNFTSSLELTPAQMCGDDLLERVVAAEKKLRPLNAFLLKALSA